MAVAMALVPASITTSVDFTSHTLPHDGTNCKCPKPYIPLSRPSWCPPSSKGPCGSDGDRVRGQEATNDVLIIGKQQLIQTCSSACGCLQLVQVQCNKKKDATTTAGPMKTDQRKVYKSCYRIGSTCQRCNEFQNWALKFISSKMISIQQCLPIPIEKNMGTAVGVGNTTESESVQREHIQEEKRDQREKQPQPPSSSSLSASPSWRIEMIGMNPKIVFVNGQELKKGKDHAVTVHEGCEIAFHNPLLRRKCVGTGRSNGTCSATARTKAPDNEFVIFRISQVLEKTRNMDTSVKSTLQCQDSCTDSGQVGEKVVGGDGEKLDPGEIHEYENDNIDEGLTQREGVDMTGRDGEDQSEDVREDSRVEKENDIITENNAIVEGEDMVDASFKPKEGNIDSHETEVRLDRSKTPRVSNVTKATPSDMLGCHCSTSMSEKSEGSKKQLQEKFNVSPMSTDSNDLQSESYDNGRELGLEEQRKQSRSVKNTPIVKAKLRIKDIGSDEKFDSVAPTLSPIAKLCRTGSNASNPIDLASPMLCRTGSDASNPIDLISPECKRKGIMKDVTSRSAAPEDTGDNSYSPDDTPSQPLHIPAKTATRGNVKERLGQESRKDVDVVILSSDDSQSQASAAMMKVDPINAAYFLPLGKTMSRNRIKILSQSLKRRDPNLIIQTEFDKASMPKFIIVDAILTSEAVQSALGFKSLIEMRRYSKDVFFVKPGWVNQKGNLHSPAMDQIWVYARELKNRKREHDDSSSLQSHESSGGWLKKMRRTHEFAPITKISAAEVNNPVIDYLHKRKKNMAANKRIDVKMTNQRRNLELSKLLNDISKVYKECPLDQYDHWRSYSYSRCASRLQYLDFDVTSDKRSLDRLSKVPGFGDKMIKHCKDFLILQKCELIEEFSHNKMRRGMGNITKIWGVGAATAADLVQKGYYNIKHIRSALRSGELKLQQRQLVGVEFYEEFQEKMERHEVRQIGKVVEEAVRVRFPDAEVTTMGSYRRGAVQLGDVDVLIVDKKFTKTTPLGAVDEVVERLKAQGHITHHLTYVDPTYFQEMPTQSCDFHDSVFLPYKDSCQTYMGVFASPLIKGKHRRIDIKFYPYREKASATIYFTGNLFFNRAIRLYAKRKKGMQLDDHGLFKRVQGSQTLGPRINCKTEKDVFNELGLVYREPHERDSFDAVRVKDTDDGKGEWIFQEDLSQADIITEARELQKHGWID